MGAPSRITSRLQAAASRWFATGWKFGQRLAEMVVAPKSVLVEGGCVVIGDPLLERDDGSEVCSDQTPWLDVVGDRADVEVSGFDG